MTTGSSPTSRTRGRAHRQRTEPAGTHPVSCPLRPPRRAEADEKREHFFLPSRSERVQDSSFAQCVLLPSSELAPVCAWILADRLCQAFSFSVWSRMDKGISTQIRIEWDCVAPSTFQA